MIQYLYFFGNTNAIFIIMPIKQNCIDNERRERERRRELRNMRNRERQREKEFILQEEQPIPTALAVLPDRPQGTGTCGCGVRRSPGETQQPGPSYNPLPSCCSGRAGSSGCTWHNTHKEGMKKDQRI
jgi:hypothetical protein